MSKESVEYIEGNPHTNKGVKFQGKKKAKSRVKAKAANKARNKNRR